MSAQRLQTQSQQGYRRVFCQRLFGSRHGSQYFEVQPSNDNDSGVVFINGHSVWARVGKAMAKAWKRVKKQAISTIQAGEHNKISPWVKQTQ
jgi:hypothetical protein